MQQFSTQRPHIRSAKALLALCGMSVSIAAGVLMTPSFAHAQPLPERSDVSGVEGEYYTFSAFPEPVELRALLEFVRQDLGLSLVETDNGLQGQTVIINAPVKIKTEEVMWFLGRLLQQKGYSITRDVTGVYFVQPTNSISPTPNDDPLATTQVIRVNWIKPTALQGPILQIANQGSGGSPVQVSYLDDLSVLLVTGNPQQIAAIRLLVEKVEGLAADTTWTRFDLVNISASSARDRVIELLGGQAVGGGGRQFQPQGQPGQPNQPNPAAIISAASSMSALAERLTVDPMSNALLHRGRPDEAEQLRRLLPVIDVPNSLEAKWYGVGSATAEAVAAAGQRQLLGASTVFTSSEGNSGSVSNALRNRQPGGIPTADTGFVGSGFVLYPEAGGFLYYGTPEQQTRVDRLVKDLGELSEKDIVVYEFYKLKHAKQEEVVEILESLISNQAPSASSPLLAGGTTRRNPINPNLRTPAERIDRPPNAPGADGEGLGEISESEDVFVVGDEANNQVVVKAPRRLQPQFAKLIQRLDLRRPQVYIQAQIVVVSETKDFRLAVEVQQIVGQWALNTNFGLGRLGTPGTGEEDPSTGITTPKDVITSLPGITTALVRSKDVPFIINAIARNVDGRLVATPQLLVDDNEEASVASLEGQPTTTSTTQAGLDGRVDGFGGYEETGPRLTVTPHISEGGYLRLEYEVELSSFTGAASDTLPPPKQTNTISAASVTVPSDMTVVLGGLTFESNGNTVLKVPLLGDIPLLKYLFRDTNKSGSKRTLYVFLTPKILRDPTFFDQRLLTSGPMMVAGVDQEIPNADPLRMNDMWAWRPIDAPLGVPESVPPTPKDPGTIPPPPTPEPDPIEPDPLKMEPAPRQAEPLHSSEQG